MSRLTSVPALLVALVASLFLAVAAPASAIPDDGAGPDTPGTSASVSPKTLRAGETIRFTLSGFPAGEVAYVKIDDGVFCSESGVHGACVVHQQRIGADGRVAGSFTLPDDLEPGPHWLRFLASEEMTDAQGNYLGVKGYTRRGGADFTVVAGSASAGGGGASGSSATAGGTAAGSASTAGGEAAAPAAVGTAVLEAGQVLTVRPGRAARAGATPIADPTPSAAPAAAPTPSAGAEASESSAGPEPGDATELSQAGAVVAEEGRFPLVGTVGLVLLLGLAAGLVLRARRARG